MERFKSVITLVLVSVSIVFSGYTLYVSTKKPCDSTLKYSIGRFDNNFGISEKYFKEQLLKAESTWEKEIGRSVFEYSKDPDFVVNLIYDERQRTTNEKRRAEYGLSGSENTLRELDFQFARTRAAYEEELENFDNRKEIFERRQSEYQKQVEYWNTRGGAPEAEYERLQSEANYLKEEAGVLNRESSYLNNKTEELNSLLERRNVAAREYNNLVQSYNKKYGDGMEFNQGEYNGEEINIYQFSTEKDLLTVLTHEFGHALGMDHTDNSSSIMYYLIEGNQQINLTPTAEDLAELARVCDIKK